MKATLPTAAQFWLLIGICPAAADDASDHMKRAEQVVSAAHVADNIRNVLPMMMAQLKPLVLQQGTTDPAEIDEFTALFTARADAASDRFAQRMAELYAAEFSTADLDDLMFFYESPTGQILSSRQPAMAKASFEIGKQLGQDLAREVLEEMQKERRAKPSRM